MGKIVDARNNWRFVIDVDGPSWTWERTRADGSVERSARSFGSLHECSTDASARGFGEWKHDERRQVAPGVDALLMVD